MLPEAKRGSPKHPKWCEVGCQTTDHSPHAEDETEDRVMPKSSGCRENEVCCVRDASARDEGWRLMLHEVVVSITRLTPTMCQTEPAEREIISTSLRYPKALLVRLWKCLE